MYNTDEFLKSIIRDRKPELTEDQLHQVCKGVRFWFDATGLNQGCSQRP